jgi:beta-lactamase class A
MQRTVNNSQLPQGLGEGATISHKTGDIGALIGDVGLIDMPNGKRYAAAVMVKRPFNDDRAYEVVQKISSVIYQHLQGVAQPGRSTNPTPYPSPTSSASPGAEEQGVETDALYNQDGRHQNSNDAEYTPDSELNPADSPPQEPNPDQASRQ